MEIKRNELAEQKCKLFLEKGFRVNDDGTIISNKEKIVGIKHEGYIRIKTKVNEKMFYLFAHQLVFYNTYGYVPEQINHINHNRDNNYINNLEPSNSHHNSQNKKMKGCCYCWNKHSQSWRVTRNFNKEIYYICYTKDEELAKRLGAELRNLKTLDEILEFKNLYKK